MATGKKKGKGSLLGSWINRFTAFIYSLFAEGRVISSFSREDSFEESICGQALERTERSAKRGRFYKFIEYVIEKSKPLQIFGALRRFFAGLALNVYGMFTLSYAVTAIFIHYIKILVSGENDHGLSVVVTLAVMAICAIPMLMSPASFTTYVSESRILGGIVRSLLGISEEKLKPSKRYSGAGYLLLSAGLAVLSGLVTYFLHPYYIIVVAVAVLIALIISANPESGVVLTVLATPFLQYSSFADVILVWLIIATAISYISKLLKRRRVISFTAESVLLIIFCGFMLAAALFSRGGSRTMLTTLMAIVVVLGGFLTTYNLMTGKRLKTCINIIAISFSCLAVIGVWNVFYDAVVDGVMYSIRDYVQPIFEGNNIYIKDSAEIFGVFAIIAFPLVFSNLARQKRATKVIPWLVLLAILVASTFIYGTYETVIALLIEFCLFWVIYSHKTMSVAIFMLIPLGIFAAVFPYISNYFDLHSVREVISGMLPLGFPDAPAHIGTVDSVIAMLSDGNLAGIGAGNHAFNVYMAGYETQISAMANDPSSFWLQVLCWSGIGGFVTLLLILVLILKNSLGYMSISGDKSRRTDTLALSCSLFIALIFGCVNCLWNDMRMLYLFWVVAGLIVRCVRDGREKDKVISAELSDEAHSADIDIRI